MNTILPLSSLVSPTTATKSSTSSSTLGMSDFFTLMTAELQYQDPLEPTDNSEFMGQMAQFAQLEQSKTMTDMASYTAASSMLGKDVLFTTTDASGNAAQKEGTVSAVDFSGDTPQCYVGGTWTPLTSVVRVGEASSSDSASASDASANA